MSDESISQRSLTVIDGDARISDTHVQQVLGYGRINDLHRIIRRHEEELSDYGEVSCREAKNPVGGRPRLTFCLNEHQAVAICMWANTARARQGRRAIIDVFIRWRRGETAPSAHPDLVSRGISKDRLIELLEAENLLLRAGKRVSKPQPARVPLTPEERQTIAELSEQGLSLSEISQITGRGMGIISSIRALARQMRSVSNG